jgi:tetratricopeptide (TPR) repeat protein
MARPARRTRPQPAPIIARSRGDRSVWLWAAILVAASLLAYSTSLRGVFVGDDIAAIVTNPHVASLWPLSSALDAPTDTTAAGRPVVSVSLALNYAHGELEPRGYHAFNLAVHIAAGLALFGVVRRTLLTPPLAPRFAADAAPLAFVIALIWLLHPLQTSAVTYVIQRAESLMGLFLLLTLYCAIRSTDASRPYWWIAGAVLSCALGMASKETMVVAPLLVTAWFWIFQRDGRLMDARVGVLLGGLAATWVLLAWLVASDARGESVGFGLGGWTWWSYLRTQAAVIVHYLRLAIVPWPLVFTYAWPPAGSWVEVLPQFLLLSSLAAATLLAVVRRHPAGFAGAWFFLVLAPSSSVLPIATEVAAEHRMYLPLAAVLSAIVTLAFLHVPRRALWVSTAVIAVVFGAVTLDRNRDYWSLEALMRDTLAKRPDHAKAHVTLGGYLLGEERFAEAEDHLRQGIAHAPATDPGLYALAHMYLGSALAAQGELAEGIRMLERAREIRPDLGETHAFLGEAYASQGRMVDAVRSFDRAIELLPDVVPLLDRAARLRATSRDPGVRDGALAVRYAERAISIGGSGDWRLLDTLAAAYAEAGRFGDAIAAVERAVLAARATGDSAAIRLLEARRALYASTQPLR